MAADCVREMAAVLGTVGMTAAFLLTLVALCMLASLAFGLESLDCQLGQP